MLDNFGNENEIVVFDKTLFHSLDVRMAFGSGKQIDGPEGLFLL